MPFLVVLIFWLAVIFASFSLFADNNATTTVALCIFALSASAAIFLILELSALHRPYDDFERAITQRACALQSLMRVSRLSLRVRKTRHCPPSGLMRRFRIRRDRGPSRADEPPAQTGSRPARHAPPVAHFRNTLAAFSKPAAPPSARLYTVSPHIRPSATRWQTGPVKSDTICPTRFGTKSASTIRR